MAFVDKLRYLRSQEAFRADPAGVLARLAWWWVRSRIPHPVVVRLQRWEIMLELPPRWRGVAKLAYAFRERYEPELAVLDKLVEPGSVAVDVGANYGIYTCILARLVVPRGRVYAFEPAEEAASVLRRNVERNGLTWVEVVQAALADFSGEASLRHEPDPGRNALDFVSEVQREAEDVKVMRLDALVSEASFIKIDVEGAEELVLKGAQRLLERNRPTVMFELNPEGARRCGLSPWGGWRVLAGLGYEFVRAQRGELLFVQEPADGGNVIARFPE